MSDDTQAGVAATIALPSLEGGVLWAILSDWSRSPIVRTYSPAPFNPNQISDEAFGNVRRTMPVVGADPVIEDPRLRVRNMRSILPVTVPGMASPPLDQEAGLKRELAGGRAVTIRGTLAQDSLGTATAHASGLCQSERNCALLTPVFTL